MAVYIVPFCIVAFAQLFIYTIVRLKSKFTQISYSNPIEGVYFLFFKSDPHLLSPVKCQLS